jgi:hypothetical protein
LQVHRGAHRFLAASGVIDGALIACRSHNHPTLSNLSPF